MLLLPSLPYNLLINSDLHAFHSNVDKSPSLPAVSFSESWQWVLGKILPCHIYQLIAVDILFVRSFGGGNICGRYHIRADNVELTYCNLEFIHPRCAIENLCKERLYRHRCWSGRIC